jgi:hypothetical protein
MISEIVNNDDVLVMEISCGCGLVAKTGQEFWLSTRRESFDCYLPTYGRIKGSEDMTLTAMPQFGLDLVSSYSLSHFRG